MKKPFTHNAMCTSTRVDANGMRTRIYVEPGGFRFRTIEVPESVLRKFSQAAVRAAAERSLRGLEIRRRRVLLRNAVAARVAEGWKTVAIANDLGHSDRYIQRIRKELGI